MTAEDQQLQLETRVHRCNGLGLSVRHFRAAALPRRDTTILLLHGYLDTGESWTAVARTLALAGFAVAAPDLRGYGDSERVGAGGYYHFPDYVADVAELAEQLEPRRLVVVGHSMGGTIACLLAGSLPDRLTALVLLEGLGPPAMPPALAVTRTRRWLRGLERLAGHGSALAAPTALEDLDDATARLAMHHPGVPEEILRSRAKALTRSADGTTLRWAHDPLHRTISPTRFDIEVFAAFLTEIRCPVLFVSGGPQGWHPEDEAERLAALPLPCERVELSTAGHMMHWTEPEQTAGALLQFLDRRLGLAPGEAPKPSG